MTKVIPVPASRSRPHRWPAFLLLAGLVLLAFWLGSKGWRTYQLVESLRGREAEARALAGGDLTTIEPERAEQLVVSVRSDFAALYNEIAFFLPVTRYLGWVPRYGPLLEATPAFLEMADAGTLAALYGVQALKPALVVLQEEQAEPLPGLVAAIDEGGPTLALAENELSRVVAARKIIGDATDLPGQIQTLLRQGDEMLPLAVDGLALLQVLPAMAGAEAPRTYLLLAQNEDELRATGGFLSGAGLLRVEGGEIVEMSFQDASLIADFTKPYALPPQPLFDYMGLELFLLRDSNFWPDFPTSAEKAMELYTYTTGVPVDGVIAFDQRFVEMIICALGPVRAAEIEGPIDCGNARQKLQDAYGISEEGDFLEAVVERKSFMGALAEAMLQKVQGTPGDVDARRLAETLRSAALTRHLQIYSRDSEVAATLSELGWDNQLENEAGQDFLLAVDSNMGFGKVNAIIRRSIAYQVYLDDTGGGEAELTLRWDHTVSQPNEACVHDVPEYHRGLTYEELILNCYWNYLRVYTPAGSQLIAEEEPVEAIAPALVKTGRGWNGTAQPVVDWPGLSVFADFLVVPYGQTVEGIYRYLLPPSVTVATPGGERLYRLAVRKQAGTAGDPLEVAVHLPPGAQLLSTTPAATVEGLTIRFASDLEQDRILTVRYRPPAASNEE